MSTMNIEPTEIIAIRPHKNADRLEVAVIKGFPVCVPKNLFTKGETVWHIPIDAIVPFTLSEKLGVTNYLSNGRVRAAKLRGETSYGFIEKLDKMTEDETKTITKWEPEIPYWQQGNCLSPHPLFHQYTDIENIRNYPYIFKENEPVVATEKIHGTNSRVGLIKTTDGLQIMIGSHRTRKNPEEDKLYSTPLKLCPDIEGMLTELISYAPGKLNEEFYSAIIFGEIYGGRIQDLKYGLNEPAYRAFDIAVNGKYLDYFEFYCWTNEFNIPAVPLLYRGNYNHEELLKTATGTTTLMNSSAHIREGIVIKPIQERIEYDRGIGRVILKMINEDYIFRNNATENH